MRIHPLANILPPMGDDEYAARRSDIAARGLLEPIWTYRGQVIDGRHRYLACRELGIDPPSREWYGSGDLIATIISLNLHRRHLDESQRAMVAARIKSLYEGEARKRQATSTGGAKPPVCGKFATNW